MRPNFVFRHSKSYFDIQIEPKYCILTFTILFWHSNWGRIWHFNIHTPILTFKLRPKYRILTFKLGPNIAFWHAKSYFDNRNEAECRILTFKFLFWRSKSYFDIRNEVKYIIRTFKILFWHSNWGQKSYLDIIILFRY